jgi:uncharacterized membrane protein YeaQ/YmgE (transglycosylase-associated protein family)
MTLLAPSVSLVLVIVIGGIIGLLFDRFAGPGWLTRQIAGKTRTSVTCALVGIAGAFIGFHLSGLLTIRNGTGALIAAAVGAAVVLWLWRMVR